PYTTLFRSCTSASGVTPALALVFISANSVLVISWIFLLTSFTKASLLFGDFNLTNKVISDIKETQRSEFQFLSDIFTNSFAKKLLGLSRSFTTPETEKSVVSYINVFPTTSLGSIFGKY